MLLIPHGLRMVINVVDAQQIGEVGKVCLMLFIGMVSLKLTFNPIPFATLITLPPMTVACAMLMPFRVAEYS